MPDKTMTADEIRGLRDAATGGPWCYTGFPAHPHSDALLAASAPLLATVAADALDASAALRGEVERLTDLCRRARERIKAQASTIERLRARSVDADDPGADFDGDQGHFG